MVHHGKRRESRLRVQLPAKLVTHAGEFRVDLRDLSQNGASVSREGLPVLRGDALLQWCGFEAFGTVKWSRSCMCGIAFDEPIPSAWVLTARSLEASGTVPGKEELNRNHAREWVAGQRRT